MFVKALQHPLVFFCDKDGASASRVSLGENQELMKLQSWATNRDELLSTSRSSSSLRAPSSTQTSKGTSKPTPMTISEPQALHLTRTRQVMRCELAAQVSWDRSRKSLDLGKCPHVMVSLFLQ